MSDIEYWKKRAKLAEAEVERLQPAFEDEQRKRKEEGDGWTAEDRDRYYDNTGLRNEALDTLRLLMAARIDENEDARAVVQRLLSYADDRVLAINSAMRAGYSKEEFQDIAPLIGRLLSDLNRGRLTIEFLSRPPKLPAEVLPVGAVFTTKDGRLLEVKRERTPSESLVTAYQWDRNEEPRTIDRKELVQPIGRVTFNAARKQIVLGLLELSQEMLAQVETEEGLKQLEDPTWLGA